MLKDSGMFHDIEREELSGVDRKDILMQLLNAPKGYRGGKEQLFAHILWLEEYIRRVQRLRLSLQPFKKRPGHLYYCEDCRKQKGWGGSCNEGPGKCDYCGKADTWVYGREYR